MKWKIWTCGEWCVLHLHLTISFIISDWCEEIAPLEIYLATSSINFVTFTFPGIYWLPPASHPIADF